MDRTTGYGLALTLLMTGLAAAPALAQTAPATAPTAASAPAQASQEEARSATQASYAKQTSDRAEEKRAKSDTPGHSRTAKQVWRDRHHLPDAK